MTSTEFDISALGADDASNNDGIGILDPGDPDETVAEQYDEPGTDFLHEKKRSKKSMHYEDGAAGWFGRMFRVAASKPETVPDAAAISMHAEPISIAVGELADADPRVARAIDFVSKGTDNPYLALVGAAAPLVLQLIRNHEPVLEPQARGFRVPFGKGRRITLKLGVRLQGIPRNLTDDPAYLVRHVFGNPEMQAELKKQGITVATRTNRRRAS